MVGQRENTHLPPHTSVIRTECPHGFGACGPILASPIGPPGPSPTKGTAKVCEARVESRTGQDTGRRISVSKTPIPGESACIGAGDPPPLGLVTFSLIPATPWVFPVPWPKWATTRLSTTVQLSPSWRVSPTVWLSAATPLRPVGGLRRPLMARQMNNLVWSCRCYVIVYQPPGGAGHSIWKRKFFLSVLMDSSQANVLWPKGQPTAASGRTGLNIDKAKTCCLPFWWWCPGQPGAQGTPPLKEQPGRSRQVGMPMAPKCCFVTSERCQDKKNVNKLLPGWHLEPTWGRNGCQKIETANYQNKTANHVKKVI